MLRAVGRSSACDSPLAYADTPLPIGFGKSISQPFIVAVMTDPFDVQPTDTVLEIGTGLGYQAAILTQLAQFVMAWRAFPPDRETQPHALERGAQARSVSRARSTRIGARVDGSRPVDF